MVGIGPFSWCFIKNFKNPFLYLISNLHSLECVDCFLEGCGIEVKALYLVLFGSAVGRTVQQELICLCLSHIVGLIQLGKYFQMIIETGQVRCVAPDIEGAWNAQRKAHREFFLERTLPRGGGYFPKPLIIYSKFLFAVNPFGFDRP